MSRSGAMLNTRKAIPRCRPQGEHETSALLLLPLQRTAPTFTEWIRKTLSGHWVLPTFSFAAKLDLVAMASALGAELSCMGVVDICFAGQS